MDQFHLETTPTFAVTINDRNSGGRDLVGPNWYRIGTNTDLFKEQRCFRLAQEGTPRWIDLVLKGFKREKDQGAIATPWQ